MTGRRPSVEGFPDMTIITGPAAVSSTTEPLHEPTARQAADAAALSLLSLLQDLPAGSPDRQRVRDRIIEMYLPLARYLAQRFRNRGEPTDDLVQVANLALVKAVDGFDPSRGVPFTGYAIPVMSGELKRHFRDKCWDIRVPRRTQELRLQINHVTDELTHALGRSPTVADLAARLGASEEEIIEGLDAGHAYRTLSLDAPTGGDGDGTTALGDLIGGADADLEQVELRETLRPLLATLPERLQQIVTMRFFGNLTQLQIAAELGLSQMHISRLLREALTRLHRGLLA
jgi:RNA polymerase sigma-B factor